MIFTVSVKVQKRYENDEIRGESICLSAIGLIIAISAADCYDRQRC